MVGFLTAFEDIVHSALSTVGQAYGELPTRLAGEVSLEWLVAEHLRLVNEKFASHIIQIQAVEQGVLRALAAAFGESVPDLPRSFDEVEGAEGEEIPDWWRAYAEANNKQNIVI